jgi:hypothetical protein
MNHNQGLGVKKDMGGWKADRREEGLKRLGGGRVTGIPSTLHAAQNVDNVLSEYVGIMGAQM